MKESDLAAALSPALEAALVVDGWMSPSMLVTIPPMPPPVLELEDEVGLESIAVVVASTAEVTGGPEVVTAGDEVLEMLSAPLPVPATICR